jgi:O-acetyl-ADP-ribose deacetylase (regulator of RNase III)
MRERIEVKQGDITKEEVDCIVNAANNTLIGGGSVDSAIHNAAGPFLAEEYRQTGGAETGEAVMTSGHFLPAEWVIHTVGPVWAGGNYGEAEMLAKCYRSCLTLAVENNIKTIAFPALSTGGYAFPLMDATRIAIREVATFLETNDTIEKVIFVAYDRRTRNAYLDALDELMPE